MITEKIDKYITEKEGMSLPYLKKLDNQLDAAIGNLRTSLNVSGTEVSNQELTLMRKIKDKIKYLYDLVEGKEEPTGRRKY